ncbi:MAG: protein-disulfide reductase DsbD N-terminal domain-containing protein [Acidobacteriota bacterium]|nr:protein-disulfide reductase DsbD N-terminal domain-containing protein [Acidobacteriota bacterium]
MKKLLLTIFVLTFGFFAQTSAQTVSGGISKGGVSKGKTVRGYVVLNIPGGLHVNSYKPESEYAIPTRVTVTGSGVSAFGVTYPPGKKRKFSFSETPISVYEGRAYFGFKVTVPKNFTGRTFRVKAAVRYQACTDEVCYAPKTKTIWITGRVR